MLRVAAQRLAQRATSLAGVAARPTLVPFARHYADDANLLKTALYDFHLEMGGKMVRVSAVFSAFWGSSVAYPVARRKKTKTRAYPLSLSSICLW